MWINVGLGVVSWRIKGKKLCFNVWFKVVKLMYWISVGFCVSVIFVFLINGFLLGVLIMLVNVCILLVKWIFGKVWVKFGVGI